MIRRAQEDMLELSTPVVKLWDGILALPLIGTLDSARTQVVMETLLEAIVNTNSKVAIIDITGCSDRGHRRGAASLKTVTAARLMGADCIISGIRPQIAQTIVHLGINLLDVTTKATLRDAFALALERTGQQLRRRRQFIAWFVSEHSIGLAYRRAAVSTGNPVCPDYNYLTTIVSPQRGLCPKITSFAVGVLLIVLS